MANLTFNEKLRKVQTELKAPKNQFNSFGKYSYRSCEDILEAAKPILLKNGLTLTISDSIHEVAGILFCQAEATISDGTDSTTVNAQAGIDPNKKGMDISQTFGSASSYARKYALNGLFLIDDTKDADATNRHDKNTNVSSNKTNGKDWLPQSGEIFDRAKNHITKGGSMATIKAKYNVSKEVEQLLNK